jgi:serine/threonine-protein kinase
MWLLVLLAVVLLGAIGFLGAQILGGLTPDSTASPSAETIELPDWVGDPITQVELQAEQLGLELDVQREFSEDVERGRVISTDPEAGTPVSEGDTITVVVSRGAEEVAVPRLIGQTEQQAVETLRSVGLEIGAVTREPSDEQPEGRVIRSDPAQGVSVPVGEQVDIVLSSGPPPTPTPSPTPSPTPTPTPTPTLTPEPSEEA